MIYLTLGFCIKHFLLYLAGGVNSERFRLFDKFSNNSDQIGKNEIVLGLGIRYTNSITGKPYTVYL